MPKMTADEIEHMLSGRQGKTATPTMILRIATVSADGRPWIVPVGFAYRDRTLYTTARARTQWLENIRHDPNVAASIDDDDAEACKITVRGRAQIVYEPGQDDDAWRDLRVPLRDDSWSGSTLLPDGTEEWNWAEAYHEMTWDEPRALVALPLDGAEVTSWRMPRVGEYLDEVWSRRYFHTTPRRFRITQLGDAPAEWRVIAEDPSQ